MGYNLFLSRADEVLFSLGWQSSRDDVSIKIPVSITSLGGCQEGHPAKKKSATLFMKCLLKLYVIIENIE